MLPDLELSVENYLPEDVSSDLEALVQYSAAVEAYGASEAMLELGWRNNLLSCCCMVGIEAVDEGDPEKSSTVHQGILRKFSDKLKSWVGKALEKIHDFGSFITKKVTGFVSGITSKLKGAQIGEKAKAHPFVTVMAVVSMLALGATAITLGGEALAGVFASAEGTAPIAVRIAGLFNKVKSPLGWLKATANGGKVKVVIERAEGVAEGVATEGGWAAGKLGQFSGAISQGFKALLTAGGSITKALQKVLSGGLSWAAKGTRVVDSAAAGAIKYGQKRAASGGFLKRMVFGQAVFMFVMFISQTFLRAIRDLVNFVSSTITRTVNAITGKGSDEPDTERGA